MGLKNQPAPSIDEVRAAAKALIAESIGDRIYDVREREGLGRDGPRVKAYGEACEVMRRFAEAGVR